MELEQSRKTQVCPVCEGRTWSINWWAQEPEPCRNCNETGKIIMAIITTTNGPAGQPVGSTAATLIDVFKAKSGADSVYITPPGDGGPLDRMSTVKFFFYKSGTSIQIRALFLGRLGESKLDDVLELVRQISENLSDNPTTPSV